MSLQSEITRLNNAKLALANSIEGKGVSVPSSTTLDGMAALVDNIKSMDGAIANYYGECGTASTDAAKVVSIDKFVLSVGVRVTIKFTNAVGTDADGDALTLNVSGTGAFPMRRYGTTAMSTGTTTTGWTAGAIQTFTYDGAAWIREYWNNTTYSNVSLGQGYATCSTAAATKAKTASLSSYSLTTGGIVAVRFTYDVPAGATLNINSKGAKAIYYRNAAITAGVIKAGDIATFIYSTYYRLISLDRGMTTLSDLGVTATAAELNYVDGVTSNIQTQLAAKQPKVTASGILKGNGSGTISAATAGTDYATPTQVNAKANPSSGKTATLTVAGWSNNSQTVSVSGVTASNNIVVSPAYASNAAWASAGVRCSAQASGSLTFTCDTAPSEALTANILILG